MNKEINGAKLKDVCYTIKTLSAFAFMVMYYWEIFKETDDFTNDYDAFIDYLAKSPTAFYLSSKGLSRMAFVDDVNRELSNMINCVLEMFNDD